MDISAASRVINEAASPVAAAQIPPEQKQLIQAVKAANKAGMFGQDNELTFQMDRETRKPVIRLVDSRTKEVIRQIPPEYVLRMAEDFRKTSTAGR